MQRDSDNEDYKANHFYVFDDSLGFSHGIKHQIESILDHPFDQLTTFGASVRPSTLTAEKKVKPDGSRYVLIRKATPAEKRSLLGIDDDDQDYIDDDYVEEALTPSATITESRILSKLADDLSDEDLRNLMIEVGHKALEFQQAVEAAFVKRGPSLEEATEAWWRVFGTRFRAAAGLAPKQTLERTKLNLAAEHAQERAESEFRAHCLLVMGVKHGMGVEETLKWAMRSWWDVFGIRAKSLLSAHVERVSNTTSVLLQAVIVADKKNAEGRLVEAVATSWFDIINLLRRDPKVAFQMAPEKWEEIVAGSYRKAGFEEVILTPRSGDFGRDVIAIKRGLGSIRVIDQVKAYGPDHLVTADDVRALLGVLQADGASKGFLTTTSGFAPRLLNDILLAPWIGPRLELIDGQQLITRLSELALSSPTPIF